MTTTHESTDMISTHDAQPILHLDSRDIDSTIELLEAAGLGPRLVCDGSCGGVSGCSLAPIDDGAIAA